MSLLTSFYDNFRVFKFRFFGLDGFGTTQFRSDLNGIGFAAPVDGRWRVLLDGSTARAGDWEVIDLPAGGTHAAALCLPTAWSATSRIAWVEHRHDTLTGAPGKD